MKFYEWERYFNGLTKEQRKALYETYETQKSFSEIYKAYQYDIDNLMYLLQKCGI